jgi:predicted Zn finger-like uncharacterized protein
MHTQCPECDSFFQVTAAQLSAGLGDVRCIHCDAEFDCLPHLLDRVPDISGDDDEGPADTKKQPAFIVVEAGQDSDDTVDHSGPAPFAVRKSDSDETEPDSDILPPWLGGDTELEEPTVWQLLPRVSIIAASILAIMLISQLLHYNRDALAASPGFGGAAQGLYERMGATLYPEWQLDSFEVRGTEAVAGGGQAPTLKILAKILIVGGKPVGLPLIRIVLRDRWSDPVASGIFRPDEYLLSNTLSSEPLRSGMTLPIEIQVADPGAEARGYVVDVCLPDRRNGLQCQLTTDPFAP